MTGERCCGTAVISAGMCYDFAALLWNWQGVHVAVRDMTAVVHAVFSILAVGHVFLR